tara:strand:+ start:455 stop:715 length:261 start_codon:yes stop_codon:yes gene_type:complete
LTIKVTALGGLSKTIGSLEIAIEDQDLTVDYLLNRVLAASAKNAGNLNPNSMLISINGTEMSALDGLFTILRSGDHVVLIPVVHGG